MASSRASGNSTIASSKSKRGKVCLNGLAQRRAKGIKHEVEFNKFGQPVGKVAAEMQSYIGLLTREHVKINIKTWKDVPNEVKDIIWETVTLCYEVPQSWKSGCLKSASVKWRNWKHTLRKDYVIPHENDPAKLYEPPKESGISEREWNQFVIYCISTDFKKMSDEQKGRRQKNVYNHRLSRKGYAGMAEEMKDELIGDKNLDRVLMWKKARVKKDGSIDNEDLKKVVEKIDERIREKDQGTIKEEEDGQEDILTSILEKSKHSGRVRAVGAYVNPSFFFNQPTEKRQKVDEKLSKQELQEAKEKMDSEMHEWKSLIGQLLNRMDNLESAMKTRDKFPMEKGSCSVKYPNDPVDPVDDEDDDDVICVDSAVFLEGKQVALKMKPTKVIVAYGTMVATGLLLHGHPMPKNAVRVSVDEVVGENHPKPLPFPISDEISTVGSALGTHVAWPKELVVRRDETPPKRKQQETEKMITCYSSLPLTMKALYCILESKFKEKTGVCIRLDEEVFDHELDLWITKRDFIPFCDLEPITGGCIVGYIWYLYKKLKDDNMLEKFVFVNPFGVSHGASCDERARKLADRLIQTKPQQLVLVPVNVNKHWILTIIEPYKDCVYVMDPLSHRNRDATWKSVVDTAMTIFNAAKEKNKFKKPPKWEIVKGPIQPDFKQCDFYVMRFMKEIVMACQDDDSVFVASMFKKREYSMSEINEVREDWATSAINEL